MLPLYNILDNIVDILFPFLFTTQVYVGSRWRSYCPLSWVLWHQYSIVLAPFLLWIYGDSLDRKPRKGNSLLRESMYGLFVIIQGHILSLFLTLMLMYNVYFQCIHYCDLWHRCSMASSDERFTRGTTLCLRQHDFVLPHAFPWNWFFIHYILDENNGDGKYYVDGWYWDI